MHHKFIEFITHKTYERPPKPPTFWNSYTRTLILDTIMKLSGTIGVTQKTMTLDTHVRLILLQTLNPQERWGTHKKRWPFQPRLFADVIGLVRCSYENNWKYEFLLNQHTYYSYYMIIFLYNISYMQSGAGYLHHYRTSPPKKKEVPEIQSSGDVDLLEVGHSR